MRCALRTWATRPGMATATATAMITASKATMHLRDQAPARPPNRRSRARRACTRRLPTRTMRMGTTATAPCSRMRTPRLPGIGMTGTRCRTWWARALHGSGRPRRRCRRISMCTGSWCPSTGQPTFNADARLPSQRRPRSPCAHRSTRWSDLHAREATPHRPAFERRDDCLYPYCELRYCADGTPVCACRVHCVTDESR